MLRKNGWVNVSDLKGDIGSELRSDILILIPVFNAFLDVTACIESVVSTTPGDVAIVVLDDCSTDVGIDGLRKSYSLDENVFFARNRENLGFVQNVNAVMKLLDRDTIVVNSDVIVFDGWFEGLMRAREFTDDFATISVLTNNGTNLSVPTSVVEANENPGGLIQEEYAKAVAREAVRCYPIVPVCVGHLMLVSRFAHRILNGFDESFGKGYGEEVDFSLRAVRIGLHNILADDVYVYHRGSSSFQNTTLKKSNDLTIKSRYPYHDKRVNVLTNHGMSKFKLARDRALWAANSLRFGVDATIFGGPWNGTQENLLNVVLALHEKMSNLQVIVTPGVPKPVKEFLIKEEIKLDIVHSIHEDNSHRYDLVYRPYQCTEFSQYEWLRRISDRVVVSFLDLLAFHNPEYHRDEKAYFAYRNLQYLIGSTADGLTFNSEFVLRDCERSDILGSFALKSVVFNGSRPVQKVQMFRAERAAAEKPSKHLSFKIEQLSKNDMLMIGTTYYHKGREVGLDLFRLMSDLGWQGRLIMVGLNPRDGSSFRKEMSRFGGSDRILRCSSLSDVELRDVYRRVGLVLYPSFSEGFGLIPFEAARFGSPTATFDIGVFKELLPASARSLGLFEDIVPNKLVQLLSSPSEQQLIVDEINSHGENFTWARNAELVKELIDRTLERPRNRVTGTWAESDVTELDADVSSNYRRRSSEIGQRKLWRR